MSVRSAMTGEVQLLLLHVQALEISSVSMESPKHESIVAADCGVMGVERSASRDSALRMIYMVMWSG